MFIEQIYNEFVTTSCSILLRPIFLNDGDKDETKRSDSNQIDLVFAPRGHKSQHESFNSEQCERGRKVKKEGVPRLLPKIKKENRRRKGCCKDHSVKK